MKHIVLTLLSLMVPLPLLSCDRAKPPANPGVANAVEVKILAADALTRENLLRIKAYILAKGDRQTYCNMYNDNPHFRFRNVDCFLDPDTGQQNINCDPKLSDFNHLVVRTEHMDYYRVQPDAAKEGGLLVEGDRKDATPADIRKDVEGFFRDILAEIAAAAR